MMLWIGFVWGVAATLAGVMAFQSVRLAKREDHLRDRIRQRDQWLNQKPW